MQQMRTGRRAVLVEPNKPLEIWESPVDPPTGADVLVAVEMAGVCGTDYHFYLGEVPMPGPMVLGHEASAEWSSAGPKQQPTAPVIPSRRRPRLLGSPETMSPVSRVHGLGRHVPVS